MDRGPWKKFVVATGNAGKLREIREILAGTGIEVVPQSEFAVPAVAETGLSFLENAILKARQAASYSGFPAIADDSGLEVDALQGAPGVRSARYAGDGACDGANNARLLQALDSLPRHRRSARFRCVMVLLRHREDPSPLIAEGSWEGQILEESRGTGGFGYDPVFWLPDQGCTAAQLAAAAKNRLSHRGQALRSLCRQILALAGAD